eukprot:5258589-Prymnesium_polylepis.1
MADLAGELDLQPLCALQVHPGQDCVYQREPGRLLPTYCARPYAYRDGVLSVIAWLPDCLMA